MESPPLEKPSFPSMTAPLTSFRTSNFAPAFFFLPARSRRALRAVYAFCRTVDDVVDLEFGGIKNPEEARQTLNAWRELLRRPHIAQAGPRTDPHVWALLQEALNVYSIDPQHLLDLLDGVERDLSFTRYATFEELKTYCVGVASTVGLACLPLFHLDEDLHRDFAVNLGIAVQLTNILRDLGTDVARGRVYLPQEDLKRFGYQEKDLLASRHNPNFVRLMGFQVDRTREFYAKAFHALPPLSRSAACPALMMGGIYRTLLEKIERMNYLVFGEKIRLSFWEKIKSSRTAFN